MRARLILPLVAGLLLSACAVVPTSGPIKPAPGLPAGASEPIVGVVARPPREGMDPGAIVAGFLDALAAPSGNYAVARQYLTPQRANSWRPDISTTVYEGPGSLEQDGTHSVRLIANAAGSLDENLRWRAAASGQLLNVDFGMVQVDHAWRISSVPDGLLLTGGDISRSYRGFPIYFGAPDRSVLVADGALVPVEATNTATLITSLLLRGPAGWLAPSVVTGFPRGTALALNSVPVVNGVAEIALTSQVLKATSVERTLIAAQLATTLAAVPGVYEVQITVDGQPLAIPGVGTTFRIDRYLSLLPDTHAPDTATFASPTGAKYYRLGKIRALSGAARAGIVSNPIMDAAHKLIAGLTKTGQIVVAHVDGSRPRVLPSSSGMSGVEFDRNDNLWALRSGALYSWDLRGQSINLAMPAGVRLERFALAPDGVRIAVSQLTAGTTTLQLGAIVRRADGFHLLGLHGVARTAVSPSDVSWSSSLMVAALVSAPSTSLLNINVISGENSVLPVVPTAIDVTASAQGPILFGTSNGNIYETSPAFVQLLTVGSQPSYAG